MGSGWGVQAMGVIRHPSRLRSPLQVAAQVPTAPGNGIQQDPARPLKLTYYHHDSHPEEILFSGQEYVQQDTGSS